MRPAMRRTAVMLVLLAAGALLGACGKSGQLATTTVVTHAVKAKAHTGTGKPPTAEQARAFADAVNLTAADVPGFKASPRREHESTAEKRLAAELLRCTGASQAGAGAGIAAVSSQNFKLERGIVDLGVSSEVSVSQTSAQASRELDKIRGKRVRECLTHYFSLLFKGQRYSEATVGKVSIMQGTPPAPGATGSFGWRITATLDVKRFKLPFYLDILGFVYGPAQVSLSSSGALRPFPAAVQQRLFSLLVKRAEAHGL
jgi:hypothetical protein